MRLLLLPLLLSVFAAACSWQAFEPVGVGQVDERPDAGATPDAGIACDGGGCEPSDNCTPTSDAALCAQRGAQCGGFDVTECGETRHVACEDRCGLLEGCDSELHCYACDSSAERDRLCRGHCGTLFVCGRTSVACVPEGMTLVHDGDYAMGEGDGAHTVRLEQYCFDVDEVSVRDYLACVAAGKCTKQTTINDPLAPRSLDTQRNAYCTQRDTSTAGADRAVNCVDWNDAARYCQWAGKQLPTEAQWESAARGRDTDRIYPWGADAPDPTLVNACGAGDCIGTLGSLLGGLGLGTRAMYQGDDGAPAVTDVFGYADGASSSGALQMAGNVGEWVADWMAPYPAGLAVEPAGPQTGAARVWRGGSWRDTDPAALKTTTRASAPPSNRLENVGFRCARPRDVR